VLSVRRDTCRGDQCQQFRPRHVASYGVGGLCAVQEKLGCVFQLPVQAASARFGVQASGSECID
jgi:hypothetical protein